MSIVVDGMIVGNLLGSAALAAGSGYLVGLFIALYGVIKADELKLVVMRISDAFGLIKEIMGPLLGTLYGERDMKGGYGAKGSHHYRNLYTGAAGGL